jgi:predicted TIM-barrel fold metal-dependent hydrolase
MMSFAWMLASLAAQATTPSIKPPPIIDMHFHAFGADAMGPPGSKLCAPYQPWPVRDSSKSIEDYLARFTIAPNCARSYVGPPTDQALLDANVAKLRERNIIAVASGPAKHVQSIQKAAPERVIPALSFGNNLPSIQELRRLHSSGLLKVIGELTFQYDGVAPNDPRIEPYYALAVALDIPVAIHVGPGAPGISYFGASRYRMRDSNALALEDVLMRHPKLRLCVMHAGWPMGDEMVALLYAHPQVYVDTGVIDYAFPRSEFHAYLKRLVDAGFADRIMFGSDQMVWPGAVDAAIEGIETATFLSPQQKRDIFYNNAARFLRLSPEEMSRHQGR